MRKMRPREYASRDQSDALIDTKGHKKKGSKKEFEFLFKRAKKKLWKFIRRKKGVDNDREFDTKLKIVLKI